MDEMNKVHILLIRSLEDNYFGVLGVYTSMEYAIEEREKVLLSINNDSEVGSGFNYTSDDEIKIVSVPIDSCAPSMDNPSANPYAF
jgi:hypothetical protein